MNVRQKKWIRFRIHMAVWTLLLCLGVVVARAYQLQVIQRDHLEGIARNGYIWNVKLPPQRGMIYDREGHELAVSVELKTVYAHPKQVQEKAKTAKALAAILGRNRAEIAKKLAGPSPFVWIERKIPPHIAREIAALGLPGVGITTETRRYYPGKEIAANLLGFAGEDNQGLEGLEKKHDDLLRGPENRLVLMGDAHGRAFSIGGPAPHEQEVHHLVLTIDKDIQYRAQEALRSAVKKTEARAGHCLVMDPRTGEILAMAVVPEFNPNAFRDYKPDAWRNRIIADCYEPGSSMKAFLLAACLDQGVVKPKDEFNCENGKYHIGRIAVHDVHRYGVLTAADIVVKSSNIGAIKLGQRLGYEKYCEYLRSFGFGSKTGMGLYGEREGFIRPADEARPIDEATHFFGQGMTVTSLQLATAMAAIANGGKLMRPYVVKSVLDASGNIVQETQPKVVRRALSYQTAREVAYILQGVSESGGTGRKAAIAGFTVGGKTGTAQKVDPETRHYSPSKYVAVFVGFTPVVNPRLVILAMVDEPKGVSYGGEVAAPVFREVGEWCLSHLRVSPQGQQPAGATVAAANSVPAGEEPAPGGAGPPGPGETKLMPDFRGLGMREVLSRGRSLGLEVVVKGSGVAAQQRPMPKAPLKGVKTVQVTFTPPG